MALISDAVCTRKLEALLVNHMDLVICNDYDVYVCMHKAITSPYGLTPSLHCTTGTSTNKRRMKSLMTPATTLCGACKLKALLQDFVFDNTTIADGQSFRNLRERPSDVHVGPKKHWFSIVIIGFLAFRASKTLFFYNNYLFPSLLDTQKYWFDFS